MANTKTADKYTPEAIERAKATLRDFYDWRHDNPTAWAWGVRFAIEENKAGHHVGGSTVVEAIRNHDFADRYGRPTKPNNNFKAIVARILLRQYPELSGRIELRKSVFDLLIGASAND